VFRLGDLLSGALRSLVGPGRVRQAAVLQAWPEVVGEVRARHTKAMGIRGNALVVMTDLPALSYELRLRRAALVDTLNRMAGETVIGDIKIVVRLPGESHAGP
jgi:predicted nucleic acid-binding Zn ribbon protein